MSKVEPHPTDKGKFQSTFDDYGHGKGNGKSRNAIYKHAKKIKQQKTEKSDNFSQARSEPVFSEENSTKSKKSDFVKIEDENSTDWSSISWADDDISDVKPKSIPEPIAAMANGQAAQVSLAAQGQVIRFAFHGLDRLITHWGRGVMNNPDYTIERHPSDMDALEASTLQLMAHYGIQMPVSPLMVWGATVGSAYAPPIMHIRKNADPNRKKKGLFSRFNFLKRRKKKTAEVIEDDSINA